MVLFFAGCDDGGEISIPGGLGVDVAQRDVETRPVCGNGIETGEDCDDGEIPRADGCSATCESESGPVCGNSVVEGAEE
ncbi:MAG: hypothetical protein R3F43_03490 [bacterium]